MAFPLYDEMDFLVSSIIATGTGVFHAGSQPHIILRTSQSVPASSASLGPVDTAVLQLPLLSQLPSASQSPSLSQPPEALQPLVSQVAQASATSGIYDDKLGSNTLGSNKDDMRMVHEYLLFMFFSQLLQNTSVTPDQSTSRKHNHAPSESPSPPSSQPQGHWHKQGADAVSDVADATCGLSTALAKSNKHPTTPECCKAAIQLLEDDGKFSDDEQVRIISLFASKSEVADSFLSIRKKRIHTAYIQSELTTIDL